MLTNLHTKENFQITFKSQTESPIEWGFFRYPDGQVQFVIKKLTGIHSTLRLKCSILSSEDYDLFTQIMATLSFKSIDIKYLYGGRSDKRSFRSGNDSYICCHVPSLVASHITTQIDKVVIWNPHYSIPGTREIMPLPEEILDAEYSGIIFPDQSAFIRTTTKPEFKAFSLNELPSIVCSKERDQADSTITRYSCAKIEPSGRYLVMDDICDGGATFLKLREAIDSRVGLDLYVTHGLFTKGVDELYKGYRNIFCTNSCPGWKLLKYNGTYSY